MELLVVLAITSLLIGFFYSSMNSFQSYLQAKNKNALETANFILFKSNLRQEFFLADSIRIESSGLTIFFNNDSINYSANTNQQIIRKRYKSEKLFDDIYLETTESYQINQVNFIRFVVRFKDTPITLVSPKYPAIDQEVNSFYKQNHGAR